MLARVVLLLVVFLCSFAEAEELRPNVFIIQLDSSSAKDPASELDIDQLMPQKWSRSHGTLLASPGVSAIQAAVLSGSPPLQQGVVKDLDWRRKAVVAPMLVDLFSKAGYSTRFHGAWALGSAAPYDPKSRGFDKADFFEAADHDTLADSWDLSADIPKLMLGNELPNKPLFCVIAEGRHLSHETIFYSLGEWFTRNHGPTVVIILETDATKKNQFHHPAKWHWFSRANLEIPKSIATDYELNRTLQEILGWKVKPKPDSTIFHQANWPLSDSPEKHRHLGSLVLDDGLALVDGLNLFSAKNQLPDLSEEMDISNHQKEHQLLLTAHAQWWQKASMAINNPRAFTVGGKDRQITRLTAQDWRMTKIIGPDTKSPLSDPTVYQKDLLGILNGLKTNKEYKETFPAYSGSWSVKITRPGRYKITASLLPRETKNPAQKELMKLLGGTAHIKLGSNEVQLKLHKGATAVSVQTDADAGVTNLECWFTGQLALTRELGAFFVEIERIGDKKFDLNLGPEK